MMQNIPKKSVTADNQLKNNCFNVNANEILNINDLLATDNIDINIDIIAIIFASL